MAHAHTPYKYPVNVLPEKDSQVVMYLTEQEADYLAKLTSEYHYTGDDVYNFNFAGDKNGNQINLEPTSTTIMRRRIFAALSGVTKPS